MSNPLWQTAAGSLGKSCWPPSSKTADEVRPGPPFSTKLRRCASFQAPAIVRMVGAKRGLVLGTAAYVVYVGAFIFPSYWTVPVIALTAGLFGALLWTVSLPSRPRWT